MDSIVLQSNLKMYQPHNYHMNLLTEKDLIQKLYYPKNFYIVRVNPTTLYCELFFIALRAVSELAKIGSVIV